MTTTTQPALASHVIGRASLLPCSSCQSWKGSTKGGTFCRLILALCSTNHVFSSSIHIFCGPTSFIFICATFRGYIITDLKPQNILLGPPGSPTANKCFLCDFSFSASYVNKRTGEVGTLLHPSGIFPKILCSSFSPLNRHAEPSPADHFPSTKSPSLHCSIENSGRISSILVQLLSSTFFSVRNMPLLNRH